jgi:hypothetical protein
MFAGRLRAHALQQGEIKGARLCRRGIEHDRTVGEGKLGLLQLFGADRLRPVKRVQFRLGHLLRSGQLRELLLQGAQYVGRSFQRFPLALELFDDAHQQLTVQLAEIVEDRQLCQCPSNSFCSATCLLNVVIWALCAWIRVVTSCSCLASAAILASFGQPNT